MCDAAAIPNALTVDLEDWPRAVLGPSMPITECVRRNTERLLALLDRFHLRATFFALGSVCERCPDLLPVIASAGHEIASHGYGHELLFKLTPDQFRRDVVRSIEIIEAQTGRRPIGYRAPAFSITRATPWVGPILAELGFQYSSSIFPIRGRRYGIPDAPRFPCRWNGCDLTEFPLTTIRRFGRNYPVAGGGYWRLLPHPVLSSAIREVNREGHPVVAYLHPYELAVNELADLKRRGWRIGWTRSLTQSLFRGRMAGRLTALFQEFPFAPMADVLGLARTDRRDTRPSSCHASRPVSHRLPQRVADVAPIGSGT